MLDIGNHHRFAVLLQNAKSCEGVELAHDLFSIGAELPGQRDVLGPGFEPSAVIDHACVRGRRHGSGQVPSQQAARICADVIIVMEGTYPAGDSCGS